MSYPPAKIIVTSYGGALDGTLRGDELSPESLLQVELCEPGNSLLLIEGEDVWDYYCTHRTDFEDCKRVILRFIGWGRPPHLRQESLEAVRATFDTCAEGGR